MSGLIAGWVALARISPAWAQGTHAAQTRAAGDASHALSDIQRKELSIGETELRLGERTGTAVTVNGTLPGPLLRFREGTQVELAVRNTLRERTSIHWHGILLPNQMDGVPGVTFKGIDPGETFIYRFPLRQYGTYWYHSHSGMQEQLGVYGPFVIEPAAPESFSYEREHTVVFSDWTFDDPHRLFAKLKKQSNFSNLQRQTLGELYQIAKEQGLRRAWSDWASWARMRMDPTDIADLTGSNFTFLANGRPPVAPWTGVFTRGEKVRLRLINSAATTHYDVRMPGLTMTVVQADGQHVRPVEVEELRMGAAETYDVVVHPKEDRPYALFAETTDRSGYALAVLGPRVGELPQVPPRRKRPLRTMADMGMGGMEMGAMGSKPSNHSAMSGMPMDHSGMDRMDMSDAAMPGMGHDMGAIRAPKPAPTYEPHAVPRGGHDMAAMSGGDPSTDHSTTADDGQPGDSAQPAGAHPHGGARMAHAGAQDMSMPPNEFGPGNSMIVMSAGSRTNEPGLGLGEDGWRVLVYQDLVALDPRHVQPPEREIVLNVTGNMERFIWGFDGKKYSESEPVRLRYGERVRLTFINQTMMEHPLHLHGMFMEMENGGAGLPPLKHTVMVKPAEKLSVLLTADARGDWAFHCHLQYHMEAGMFRVFSVG